MSGAPDPGGTWSGEVTPRVRRRLRCPATSTSFVFPARRAGSSIVSTDPRSTSCESGYDQREPHASQPLRCAARSPASWPCPRRPSSPPWPNSRNG
ncbi:hypothetical protein [Lysobacter gummosus]|uniref:hypothetical protein n=1 Tax=Lysobacter gummosus TaxID=262324 RepID=UPI003639F792